MKRLAVLAIVLASCSPAPPPPREPAPEAAPVPLTFADLAPTDQETAWRQARLASGAPLRVATVHIKGTFEESPDGRRSGLDYDMAVDLARVLGLKLDVTVPQDLRRFFSRDGVLPADVETNAAITYTPDLLREVDLYIGPFTILPWRERLMSMVALFPMQNFLAGRRGEEIASVTDLNGKRLAVLKDSMQDNLLHNLSAAQGLHLQYVYVRPEDDLFTVVAEKKADYTLDGALFFAQNRIRMNGLSLSPFPSDPVRVGWAMKKTEPVLASLVRKYFDKVQADGSFSRWFEAANGTTFADYLSVLATAGEPPK
jgi:ABC-type amino acid transport substrate-binding protein